MRIGKWSALAAASTAVLSFASSARAEPQEGLSVGRPSVAVAAAGQKPDGSALAQARDLIARARVLDEVAASEEKLAVELAKKVAAQRSEVKRLRHAATFRPEKDALTDRADAIEAELLVNELDIEEQKHAAAEHHRSARELREHAVDVVRGRVAYVVHRHRDPLLPMYIPADWECSPPYTLQPDGRRLYKHECL